MRRSLRFLPRDLASLLDAMTEGGGEFVKDCLFSIGQICCFARIGLEVVKFEWLKRAVLDQFPIAVNQGFNGLASVSGASFSDRKSVV